MDELIRDGKIVVLDTVAELDGRLKLEEAGTKAIGTLSANVGGKTVTLSAEDMVQLKGRLDRLEEAAAERERARVLTLFSAEGKVPRNAEGKAYSEEDLRKPGPRHVAAPAREHSAHGAAARPGQAPGGGELRKARPLAPPGPPPPGRTWRRNNRHRNSKSTR